MTTSASSPYQTHDIYLSGFLIANGMKFTGSVNESGNIMFRFEPTDQLNKLVESYYALTAVVNPQRYGYALKVLKNLVYRDRNENKYHESTTIRKTR